MALGRETILDAAIALLDEVGIDQLTTRKLAQRLNVQQPALYWHFTNKRALWDAINAEILRRHHTYGAPRPGDGWQDFLRNNARSFRNALLAHRDGGRVHVGTRPEPRDLEEYEAQLRLYVAAGFDAKTALLTSLAVSRYVIGSVLEEQAEDEAAHDHEVIDAILADYPLLRSANVWVSTDAKANDEAFEAGLALLVSGIAAKLGTPAKTAS